jgi:glycosyltransferase involved in cell wall biosynthesis
MTSNAGPHVVLQVIARMNVGGPAWIVAAVTRGINDAELQSTLICGQVEHGEADFLSLRDPDLPVTRIDSLGRSVKVFGDLLALFALVRLMRKIRPTIVHTHTAKAGVLGRIAAVIARVPIRVHTFHGHVLHGYFSPRVTALVRLSERLLARMTTHFVAVGSQVRDELVAVRIGRIDQYNVIAPGVASAPEVSRTAARNLLGLADEVPVIAFVGRLTQIKRPDRLLDAFRLVLHDLPEAVLIIAGEGDLYESTRAAAVPFGDSVRFLGWRSDLDNVYAAADLVVLTSDNEGMPVSLIEAAMAGVPCVTTDVGSAREVVIDHVTGRVVSCEAAALANATSEILRDDEILGQMQMAARQHAHQHFGGQRLIDAHRQLYQSLISAHA